MSRHEGGLAGRSVGGWRSLRLGWHVLGLGILALGLVSLALGEFDPGQPVPKWIPGRTALAYVADAFLVVAGLALQWRRTRVAAAAALTAYYGLLVVLLMDGRVILAHPAVIGAYTNTAEQLALPAAGLIVYAANARLDPAMAARLTRIGQVVFGVCAILFGVAHFAYMNMTAPLVPKWLPPSQLFWGYATGVAHITAGLALISGVQARLAAVLLTVMFAAFTPLVHLPMLLGDPSRHFFWTENALNIALVGAAWVVADSLARSPRPHAGAKAET